MREIPPQQIILLLAFTLLIVINLVIAWTQRRARERQRPAEAVLARRPDRGEWPPAAVPPRARTVEPARRVEASRRSAPSESPPALAMPPIPRQAPPLGGRAAVRRAIVAMAILGPCPGLQLPPEDLGTRDTRPSPVPRPGREESGLHSP
jgi:hypothetical protein